MSEFVIVTNKDESYRGLKYKNKVYLEDNKTIKTFKGGKVQVINNPE